jgi:hypothetical protein
MRILGTIASSAREVPGAPTIGTATAGNANASVTFTAPVYTGGVPIISYTVTSTPGSLTATGASSPITVSGLTNGTAYTFRVTATNSVGTGPASAASNSVTPVVPAPSTVEYLVVAGGGGGGSGAGGGGGAGGFRTAAGLAVTAGTPITVTVGAGGAVNTNGNASVFSSITSVGGGGGGSIMSNGLTGGSGGGSGGSSSGPATSGGAGTAGQGNAGGSNTASAQGGGGGGGAGVAGSNGTGVGGNGGNGLASSITGTSVTYAGGGGGCPNSLGSFFAPGGTGGGGRGDSWASPYSSSNPAVSPGTANTGGGGGGGTGGAIGGSGVVVIRYADTFPLATSTTGSPTITTTGGYRIYQWNGSGSITF